MENPRSAQVIGEPYYDLSTVAAILGYGHIQSLRNALHKGRLKVKTFKVKNTLVIEKKDFDRFMDEKRAAEKSQHRKIYMKDYRRGILKNKGIQPSEQSY